MKPSKPLAMTFLCSLVLLAAHEAVHAQAAAKPLTSDTRSKVQQIPGVRLCPDLKANLTLTKGGSGLVTILGTVTNVGKGDYDGSSVAQVIMNLAYAPQYSFAMTGVTDILVTKPFAALKAGTSFTVNATYQIPNFGGWAAGSVQDNAHRLFTLRAVKQNMSNYQSGEDCNPGNNGASTEVAYRDTKH
jgi:hypothetical protein